MRGNIIEPDYCGITVSMFTGLVQDYNLPEALKAGANACMPFSAQAIVEKVAKLLNSN